MNLTRLLLFVLLPLSEGLASGNPLNQAVSGAVIFDQDLTRGPGAFSGRAQGGEWRHGWRLTGRPNERLVWDAGRAIKNGWFEFWLTADTPPFSPLFFKEDPQLPEGKMDRPDWHWAGVSGVPEIAMEKHAFALRLGEIRLGERRGHGWSKIVVLGPDNVVDTQKTEISVGNFADWLPLCDSWQVIHFRIEWRDGVAALYRMNGERHECPPATGGRAPVHIADLRYPWLGGADDEKRFGVAGLRFLRARLVDLHRPGSVPAAAMSSHERDPR